MSAVDLLVVGCGPVGALAANLAGEAGLTTVVIDREEAAHPLPRAVHLDHEMMRLFQSVGLAETIRPTMNETEGHLHVGADHGVIRYMGTAGHAKPFGWANDYFFYQPELEELLRAGLVGRPGITLSLGRRLVALRQDPDSCVATIEGPDGPEAIEARFVIACDGARSEVRRLLRIDLDDLDFEEPWLVVDAEVDAPVRFPDLTGVPPEANLQRLSVMMCDPVRPATVVPGRGRIRRWEFMLLPGEDERAMTAPGKVGELLAPYLDGVPHRVLRAATYRFHGLIAERWQDGRVFLAGDAAHQTPPFFGQGMCHGMRDVANLIWKIAAVVEDLASPTILETYQAERDPHVRSVIDAAVAAGRYICELDPARAAVRDAEMRARGREAPSGTAADLIPPLSGGAILVGSPGAGERFVQPAVSHGRLLDDATGHGWRIVVRDASSLPAAAEAADNGPVAISVVDASEFDDGGILGDWLDRRGVRSTLVRPDFYVFGSADDPAELVDALEAILTQRGPASEREMIRCAS